MAQGDGEAFHGGFHLSGGQYVFAEDEGGLAEFPIANGTRRGQRLIEHGFPVGLSGEVADDG